MDSNNSKPWQWLTKSPARILGLLLLMLALMFFLTLMVIVSQKSTRKKAEANIPQASPSNQTIQRNPSPSSLPDPTKDWKKINFVQINLKIPSEATSSTKIKDKLSSLQILASSAKPSLIIESLDHSGMFFKTNPVKGYTDQLYQKNSSSSATLKMITKPIEILIGGLKGYEYYYEGTIFNGFDTTYPVDNVKHRVIQFDRGSQAFVVFSNLNPESEQILSTIKF